MVPATYEGMFWVPLKQRQRIKLANKLTTASSNISSSCTDKSGSNLELEQFPGRDLEKFCFYFSNVKVHINVKWLHKHNLSATAKLCELGID